jgi:hypothetical protein
MLFSEAVMARRLNWERNTENRRAKSGMSITDETEFRSRDMASRWIASAEEWNARVAKRKAAVARHKAAKKRK